MREGSLLFFHGFLGQPGDWDAIIEKMPNARGQDVRLINLWEDLPLLTFSSLSEWLDAFGQKYRRLSPWILCGYSLGARLAMSLACRYPDLSEGLVVISGHPGLTKTSEKSARFADDRRWAGIFQNESWESAISKWNERDVFGGHKIDPVPQSPATLRAALELFSLGKQPDLRSGLSHLDMPILWIVGEKDEKFSFLADEPWLRSTQIAIKRIPDCGHRVLHEKPRELATLLDAFVVQAAARRETIASKTN